MDNEPFSDASSEPVYIGVNGFGIGGGYVHVALTDYRPSAAVSARLQRPPLLLRAPSWAAAQSSPPHFLLPLSAVSEEHLSMYEASLAHYLDAHPQVSTQRQSMIAREFVTLVLF
jgi:acyl transferase domain-containing protein